MTASIVDHAHRTWPRWLPRSLVQEIRARFLGGLEGLRWGRIRLDDGIESRELGRPGNPGPCVDVRVHDPEFYVYAGLGGSIGAGQSYFLGLWDTPALVDLVRIMVRNRECLERMDSGLGRLGRPFYEWFHRRRENSVAGSRANIAAHYDLGNGLFELMLDPSMMYSAAVWPHPEATLAQAQTHKLDLICDKLQLDEHCHLLEIGTGWGGLALHAARRHGCRVTTTTISEEQYAHARQRVREAGLEELVSVIFQDYRTLSGRYDRIVSIEMIEAVGHRYLPGYFQRLDELLSDDGRVLLQAITIPDQHYARYRRSVDFIKRFVFPGGSLPSVNVMLEAARRHTSLRLCHLEDIGAHYARTLRVWRENCLAQAEGLRGLGYGDGFQRLWHFYLAYCEGGFLERSIGDVQVVFDKPETRLRVPATQSGEAWLHG